MYVRTYVYAFCDKTVRKSLYVCVLYRVDISSLSNLNGPSICNACMLELRSANALLISRTAHFLKTDTAKE